MDTTGWVILTIVLITVALWIYAIADIFRGAIRGSGAKIMWLIVVLLFPVIGVILYFLYKINRS